MNGRQTGYSSNRKYHNQQHTTSRQQETITSDNSNINNLVENKDNILIQILDDESGTVLIEQAENLGKYLAKKMSTSQIRSLFFEAKGINFTSKDGIYRINLLRAKLAYTAGRFKKQVNEIDNFRKILDTMLKSINSEERFKRFIDFFEAVVAYHRAHGGKE